MTLPSKMPTAKHTYRDYLKWPDDERREIIDGVPFLMSPAPSVEHQYISGEIFRQFANYLLDKECRVFDAPFEVRLAAADEHDDDVTNVVQPDLVVICDKSRLDRKGYRGVPALIVEILSPASAKLDLNEKYNLYERSGVKEYWVVFPLDQILDVYLLDEQGKYKKSGSYEKGTLVKPSIFEDLQIDLNLVFRDL